MKKTFAWEDTLGSVPSAVSRVNETLLGRVTAGIASLGSLPKITVGAGGGAGNIFLYKVTAALKRILPIIKKRIKKIPYLIIFLVTIAV